jgi:hypothetical protein
VTSGQGREEDWQELVQRAREQIQRDLDGRALPPAEEVLAQVREKRDCTIAPLGVRDRSGGEPDDLPISAAWLFPEYDFHAIDLDRYRGVIIERLLERGTWEQVRWLFATYGEECVALWVRLHGFRLLSRRSFALWRVALGVTDYVAPDWAAQAKEMEDW